MTPDQARAWLEKYGERAKTLGRDMERFRMLKAVRGLDHKLGRGASNPWDDFDISMEDAVEKIHHLIDSVKSQIRR
jgi:hypothetical protein